MKKLFLLFLIFSSCNLSTKNPNSQIKETNNKTIEKVADEEFTDAEEFKYAYDVLIKSYKEKIHIDSLYVIDNDTFNVILTYSCLLNSKVIVPKSYFAPNLNDDLTTHNFIVDLKIIKNNKIFIEKSIEKKYFFNTLNNEDIKKYGILINPYIRREDKMIFIDISVSIPLTDIGVSQIDTLNIY